MYYNPSLLVENGGHVNLTHNWATSIFERMDFVRRKASTAKSRETAQEFQEKKNDIFEGSGSDCSAELIFNWDQTGIRIVSSSTWTMEKKGSKRVELTGINNNHSHSLWLFVWRPATAATHLQRKNSSVPSTLSISQ